MTQAPVHSTIQYKSAPSVTGSYSLDPATGNLRQLQHLPSGGFNPFIDSYGRLLMTLHLFNNAAREGARYAIAHIQPVVLGGTTYGDATTDVTNVVTSFLAGQTLSSQQVQVYLSDSLGNNTGTWTDAGVGDSITCKITGNYKPVVPTLLRMSSTMPITATAVMRVESN